MQDNILTAMPDAELRIYAVWVPTKAGDARERWDPQLLDDPRVLHYWDQDILLGRWFPTAEGFEGVGSPILWDAWVLYGAASFWNQEPTELIGWDRTIIDTSARLSTELDALLNPVAPTTTVTPTLTITPTLTVTPTMTIAPTLTVTPTLTITPTLTATPTISTTPTLTPTLTASPSATVTASSTATLVPTAEPSSTPVPSETPRPSPTHTATLEPSPLPTEMASPTPTPEPSSTPRPTEVPKVVFLPLLSNRQ